MISSNTASISKRNLFKALQDDNFKNALNKVLKSIDEHEPENTRIAGNLNYCRICKVQIGTAQDFRNHCKTEVHVLNLKESVEKYVNSTTAAKQPFVVASLGGEPSMFWLKIPLFEGQRCGVLKALAVRRDAARSDPVDLAAFQEVVLDHKNYMFAVLLVTAGHFSGVVFKGEDVVAHKSFHRYVVRAKQGHAQWKRDASGNRCHSGGSSIRRHNEIAFQSEIGELMLQWSSDYFSQTKSIFVHYPHRLTRLFFDKEEGCLRSYPEKVRAIPFITGRPTFELCKEIASKLFRLHFIEEEVLQKHLDSQAVKEDMSLKSLAVETVDLSNLWIDDDCQEVISEEPQTVIYPNTSNTSYVDTSVEISVKNDRIFDEVFTACCKLDTTKLDKILSSNPDDISEILNKSFGPKLETILHFVARNSKNDRMLHLLLSRGCNPCKKDNDGKVPFELACCDIIRNGFVEFRNNFPNIADWDEAKIPTEVTQQAAKKRKRRKPKKTVNSSPNENLKAAENTENEEKERFLSLSDESKRKERSVKRCFMCGNKYQDESVFQYLSYKFCSVQCLRSHRHQQKKL